MSDRPVVFISYAWSSEKHKQWVSRLAARLSADDVDIVLDQWSVAPGEAIPLFMEKAVRESNFVLVLCTPAYKRKSDSRTGGVGYEGDIMTAAVLERGEAGKFIPILCEGERRTAIPLWLLSKHTLDFRAEPVSELEYQKLIGHLRRKGMRPSATAEEGSQRDPGTMTAVDRNKVEVVTSEQMAIPSLMRRMLTSASWWRYQGGTGTWLRAATIPALAGRARSQNVAVEVSVQMLDPRDDDLCHAYAAYRRSLSSASMDGGWTGRRVKCEVLATVVMMSIMRSSDALLVGELSFIPYFSSFRYDMSNEAAVITTEDPMAPCLYVRTGSYYYEAYRSELIRSVNMAEPVRLEAMYIRDGNVALGHVSEVVVREVLAELQMGQYLRERDYATIAEMVRHPKNRYD